MATVLLLEIERGVATVTLNRPERRNALSKELLKRLQVTVTDLDRRGDVLAIVLTGAGVAFCAGLDLVELGEGRLDLAGRPNPRSRLGPIPEIGTPLIGAINGAAITGGLELALWCDFLVASEHARFADTHVRVGIQPGWGLTVLLPEAIGLRRALEMSATGNFIDAETALAWGLVNHVVPHEELIPAAQRLAADVASCDPDGVRTIISTYRRGNLMTRGDAWAIEADAWLTWRRGGIDPADVAKRREAVIARGRAQP